MSRFHYIKSQPADFKFPVRYLRHPKSGVVVEIEPTGVCTLSPIPGPFRSFAGMKDGGSSGKGCWTEADEIGVLLNHGWKLVQP